MKLDLGLRIKIYEVQGFLIMVFYYNKKDSTSNVCIPLRCIFQIYDMFWHLCGECEKNIYSLSCKKYIHPYVCDLIVK